MKQTLLLVLSGFLTLASLGQAPGQINYQGVARNVVGNVLPNQHISLRLTIHDGGASGTIVYQETRNLKTNLFGLFNIAIGSAGADNVQGSMSTVDWANSQKYLQVEMDPAGRNAFIDMGTAQLLTVPYAFYASAAKPAGAAGGSLAGSYPNPSLANGAVTTTTIADGSVTADKLVPGVIPVSLPVSGTVGGDLTGTYPNPSINAAAVNNSKIADGAISTNKLADDIITTGKIADGAVTAAKLAPGVIPTSLPPGGTAGGDLSGTYPNPVVAASAIDGSKLADNAVSTSKVVDSSITAAKLATGVIPASLPPGGTAGGDLSGTYPNPAVNKIQGVTVATTAPVSGQVLKYNGTQWAPAADNNFSLPYTGTGTSASGLFNISNTGTGMAISGINTSTNAGAWGIEGKISGAAPGDSSTGVKGTNNSKTAWGFGVWGSHAGNGPGVFGSSSNGRGVYGYSKNGSAVYGKSNAGNPGRFEITNTANYFDAVLSTTNGAGSALSGMNTGIGNGGWGTLGVAMDATAIGVMGVNYGGGEGIRGNSYSNTYAAVVGENAGSYGGVVGVNKNTDNTLSGAGVVGRIDGVNTDGYIMYGDAVVGEMLGDAQGNLAVFRVDGVNMARIDKTGVGYFNGGTVNSGADVAEYFDVEGSRNSYEPGDVLVISQNSDRTVEKSSTPYSTLVAGVYATKPGVLLTEKNGEQDDLTGGVPMGVIGVIPTKVCMEGGPVKRGDLIVTSSIPGVAMKADARKVQIGQVIGKALQDFNGAGVAKINILVSVK